MQKIAGTKVTTRKHIIKESNSKDGGVEEQQLEVRCEVIRNKKERVAVPR